MVLRHTQLELRVLRAAVGLVGIGGLPVILAEVRLRRRDEHLSWTAWDFHAAAGPTPIRNWDYDPTEAGRIAMDELRSGGEWPRLVCLG